MEEVNGDGWVGLPHEGAGLSHSSPISLYLGLVLQGCPIWKLEIRSSLSLSLFFCNVKFQIFLYFPVN